MTKILIKGGCVLSLDAKTGNHREADVLIDDERITEIGKDLRARDAEVIDASDSIVMPGFVDTHRHVWESLFRGLGDVLDVAEPGEIYGPHHSAEDIYAATLIGLLGAAEAGITTVVDWADFQPGDGRLEAALQAHADAGIRTVFVNAGPAWAAEGEGWRQRLRRLVEKDTAPSTSFAAGPLDPVRGESDRVSGDWALARELGLRIHTHAGARASDSGLVAELASAGLVAADVNFVHCSHLDEADLDAIAASGASVSLAPSSEMAGGAGSSPIQHLIDRRIRPALGIGNERAAPGDMFAQMRAIISVQHATLFDLKLAGKAGVPNLLSTREVIRHATIDGARAAGLSEVTGSLAPGKQADIVLLRTDRPNISPVNDPIGAVVWGMDTSNVDWVFVGGRAVMRDGVLDADVHRARDLAMSAQQRVADGSGLLAGTGVAGGPQ